MGETISTNGLSFSKGNLVEDCPDDPDKRGRPVAFAAAFIAGLLVVVLNMTVTENLQYSTISERIRDRRLSFPDTVNCITIF